MSNTLPHKRTTSELDAASTQPGMPLQQQQPSIIAAEPVSGEKIGLAGVDSLDSSSSSLEPAAKRPATESTLAKAQTAVTAGLESVRAQTAHLMADVHVPSSLVHAQEKIVAGAHQVKEAMIHGFDQAKASMSAEPKGLEGAQIKAAAASKEPSFMTQAQAKSSAALASASVVMKDGLAEVKKTLLEAKDQVSGMLHRETSALPAASADGTKAPLLGDDKSVTEKTDLLKTADKSADISHSKEKEEGSLPGERCDDEFPQGKHESDNKIGSQSEGADAPKAKRATRGAAGKKAASASAAGTKDVPLDAVAQAERDAIVIQ